MAGDEVGEEEREELGEEEAVGGGRWGTVVDGCGNGVEGRTCIERYAVRSWS